MLTTYTTLSTVENRATRHGNLCLTSGATRGQQTLGVAVRVDGADSMELLNTWLFNDDTKVSLTDTPYAVSADGIAAFIGRQPIAERTNWSHSSRRRRGVIAT